MVTVSDNSIVKLELVGEVLDAYFSEEPPDGYNYTIEVDGSSTRSKGSRQSFYARKLSGLSASDFPDQTDLSIEGYRSGFKYISMAWVRKKQGVAKIQYAVHMDFANWDLPESLASFLDRFCKAIEDTGQVSDYERERSEYGYDLYITVDLKLEDDIYKRMCGIEDILESIYRRELVPATAKTEKYGDDRFHWWIRYVLVPLVCSGGIAAILVKYLLS